MKPNEPAFPTHSVDGIEEYKGLTKREYFAGLAMQGITIQEVQKVVNRAIKEYKVHVKGGLYLSAFTCITLRKVLGKKILKRIERGEL